MYHFDIDNSLKINGIEWKLTQNTYILGLVPNIFFNNLFRNSK